MLPGDRNGDDRPNAVLGKIENTGGNELYLNETAGQQFTNG